MSHLRACNTLATVLKIFFEKIFLKLLSTFEKKISQIGKGVASGNRDWSYIHKYIAFVTQSLEI